MVIFITSKIGFEEMKNTISTKKHAIWIGNGVLADEEIKNYRSSGINLSVFDAHYDLSNSEHIEDAILTIKEHHPNERIFVER